MPYKRHRNGISYQETNAPVDNVRVFENPEDDWKFGGYNYLGQPVQLSPGQIVLEAPFRAFGWLLTGKY